MKPRRSPRPKSGTRRPKKPPLVIGWREIVSLPDLGLMEFQAKIDTGARTTALHAENIERFRRNGTGWVRFTPTDLGHAAPDICEARILTTRAIKNTSGVPEERIIIRTHLHIEKRNFLIDVSLADRTEMAFPIIIGRTALRNHRLLVNCSRSWLTKPSPLTPMGKDLQT